MATRDLQQDIEGLQNASQQIVESMDHHPFNMPDPFCSAKLTERFSEFNQVYAPLIAPLTRLCYYAKGKDTESKEAIASSVNLVFNALARVREPNGELSLKSYPAALIVFAGCAAAFIKNDPVYYTMRPLLLGDWFLGEARYASCGPEHVVTGSLARGLFESVQSGQSYNWQPAAQSIYSFISKNLEEYLSSDEVDKFPSPEWYLSRVQYLRCLLLAQDEIQRRSKTAVKRDGLWLPLGYMPIEIENRMKALHDYFRDQRIGVCMCRIFPDDEHEFLETLQVLGWNLKQLVEKHNRN